MTVEVLIDTASKVGALGVLAYLAWALINEQIVSGKAHRRVIGERDEFKKQLFETLRLAGRATYVAEKLTDTEARHGDRLEAQRQLRSRWQDQADDDE